MKMHKVVFLGLTVIAPGLALAAKAPDPLAIGAAQAVFNFCSQVDRAGDKSFDKQGKELVAGLSKERIESLRESAAYLRAYQTLQSVLKKFSAADALQACRAIQ